MCHRICRLASCAGHPDHDIRHLLLANGTPAEEFQDLLAEVNTAAWNDVKLSAGRLAALTEKYDLDPISEAAREIETAARNQKGQIELIELIGARYRAFLPTELAESPAWTLVDLLRDMLDLCMQIENTLKKTLCSHSF